LALGLVASEFKGKIIPQKERPTGLDKDSERNLSDEVVVST